MQRVQQQAAFVLGQVLGGQNLNKELSKAMEMSSSAQARGALQDLAYGTLRHYGQLEHILQALLNKPMQDSRIRHLLLIAIYQLQYSKSGSHTIVDQAVHAAKSMNPATAGLVNAVLRNFLRQKSQLLATVAATETARFNYPQWWIDEVKKQYGNQAAAILETGNQHPPMTLRLNTNKLDIAEYLERLQQQGLSARMIGPAAALLAQPQPVEALPGFAEGQVSVQDAGAQHAARWLGAESGMRVLDACAAPGGKSGHLLELADIELTAMDKDEQRLARVRQNLQRLGKTANLVCGDALQPATWWDGRVFDRILADVPCSGSGVVRRHPDIKWLRRLDDIERFGQQQEKILDALWPLLAPGGRMLYVTCSIFARENQQVIQRFLALQPQARQLSLDEPALQDGQLLPTEEHDGFFYALLHKTH